MRSMPIKLLAGLALPALALAALPADAAPLKVAGTGSSSMAGVGSSAGHHVTDELGKALGTGFTVVNFGVAATTAIKAVPNAYASTQQMKDALASNPDVVLFWFGGNDSWADTWPAHKGEFRADYTSIVRAFQALPSHPKTFLIRLWVFKEGPAQKMVLDQEILPMIHQIALDTNSFEIDYRTFIEPHPEWFNDGMHANDTGTVFIGKFFADQITAALKVSGDGGAADTGATSDAGAREAAVEAAPPAGGGGDASVEAPPPAMDAAVAETPTVPPTSGSAGAPASTGAAGTVGTGGSGGGGSGGAPAAAGSGGSAPSAQGGSGGCGCNHGGAPTGGPAVLLLAALALLARGRQPTRR